MARPRQEIALNSRGSPGTRAPNGLCAGRRAGPAGLAGEEQVP